MSARSWCFTRNNPDEPDSWTNDSRIRFYIYQLEKSESQTYHWQGYIEFNTTMRLSACKTILPNAHWEPRRGSADQAINYASKDDTRIAGPWMGGTRCTQGKRVDLQDFRIAVLAGASDAELLENHVGPMAKFPRLASTIRKAEAEKRTKFDRIENLSTWQRDLAAKLAGDPDKRKVMWYWEESGNVGKTRMAKHICTEERVYYSTGGKHADILYAYEGERVVIFDFPRSATDFICYTVIESLKNGIITQSKYESRTFRFEIPHVVVFANCLPDRTKLSDDRWDINHIFNNI